MFKHLCIPMPVTVIQSGEAEDIMGQLYETVMLLCYDARTDAMTSFIMRHLVLCRSRVQLAFWVSERCDVQIMRSICKICCRLLWFRRNRDDKVNEWLYLCRELSFEFCDLCLQ